MEIRIRASDFGGFDYCQEKWLAARQGKIPFISSPQMEEGARLHRALDKQFLSENPEGVNFPEFIKGEKFGRVRPQAIGTRLNAKFGDILLAGIPDELVIDERGLCVIEDKFSAAAYNGYKHQARLYSLILHLLFPSELALKTTSCKIRQVSTLETMWEEVYTEQSRNEVIGELFKIRDVLSGFVKPIPCKHTPRCVINGGDEK